MGTLHGGAVLDGVHDGFVLELSLMWVTMPSGRTVKMCWCMLLNGAGARATCCSDSIVWL